MYSLVQQQEIKHAEDFDEAVSEIRALGKSKIFLVIGFSKQICLNSRTGILVIS